MTKWHEFDAATKADVTPEMIANYIAKIAYGDRTPSKKLVEIITNNFDKFDFDIENDYVTKCNAMTMSREQLSNNCDLCEQLKKSI